MRRVFCILLFLTSFSCFYAQKSDSMATNNLEASLLTCSPGTEIYQYYGHTALLIKDLDNGQNYVFNYGLFDFNTPNFLWRFLLGECDYLCGVTTLESFLRNYEQRGTGVREDVLNLTSEETAYLFDALKTNSLPENATYRYDFFYDNCATRVRDQIEHCINGKIHYASSTKSQSLRDIVHESSMPYKWSYFGQDLLLGAQADRMASRIQQEFSPIYLQHDICTAYVENSEGRVRPLVTSSQTLVEDKDVTFSKGFPLSPKVCCLILLLVTIILSAIDIRKARPCCWLYDLFLMLLQGLAGLLITFMFFFSKHPTVDTNWLILLFNPIPLVVLYWVIRKERHNRKSIYHAVVRIYLFLFICSTYFIPQYISIEVNILALCLLLRSMSNHIIYTYRLRT